ncbi:MAG TPA: nucleotide exchange factor GrpE [Kiritimatiellia bacterium]|nr:nucleotide exchange factor GrpE [Kiritimatiellia bacterium]HPS08456.1 nucleotide exchange factor GrpE [Kiritimatiellia bacterium]
MFSKNKTKSHETAADPEAAPATAEAAPAPQSETSVTASVPQSPAEPAPAPAATPAGQPSAEAVELALLKDRFTRLMADFDNYRKRQAREREDLIKRANEELLGDLIPIVDHLELALSKTADQSSPFVTGIKLVYDQSLNLFDRYGMQPIDAKGKPFDPSFHEALSQMNSATVPANVVIDQFRRGWLLAGRLLRPAQVIVSSGALDQQQAESENDSVSD